MASCVFCEILAGRLPSSIVVAEETCTAFMDIQPVNPGHVLVIPNRHAASLEEMNESAGECLFRTGQRIASALRKSGVRCDGVNFWLADGEAAGQEVFHVHLHVFPRYRGDGFKLSFSPSYHQRPERSVLEEVASRIRSAITF